jgi:hypothetical protein
MFEKQMNTTMSWGIIIYLSKSIMIIITQSFQRQKVRLGTYICVNSLCDYS